MPCCKFQFFSLFKLLINSQHFLEYLGLHLPFNDSIYLIVDFLIFSFEDSACFFPLKDGVIFPEEIIFDNVLPAFCFILAISLSVNLSHPCITPLGGFLITNS